MKLHLGCGKRYIPGFVHIDLSDYPHIDFKQGVDNLGIFRDNTVTLVYASHVLEYFDRVEVKKVLAEWRRVLKRGGILRIAVPDFEALVEVYLKYRDLNLIHGPLYGKIEIVNEGQPRVMYHKTCYDFSSLSKVLTEAGFSNVNRYDWRQTEHRDYDDYSQAYIPHMDKSTGKLISLNVEATKA